MIPESPEGPVVRIRHEAPGFQTIAESPIRILAALIKLKLVEAAEKDFADIDSTGGMGNII